jgi:probable HAF family extracellular repeat protein
MKCNVATLTGAALLAVLITPLPSVAQQPQQKAQPLPHYMVTDLGTLPGGNFSQAEYVRQDGLLAGVSAVADGTQHAVLWFDGAIADLAGKDAAGLNSVAYDVNQLGQVTVQGEIATKDPNTENFCSYGTGLECRGFVWQNGVLTQLPTLGGNNASLEGINNRGEMAGYAENNNRDPDCPTKMAVNGTGPQILDFEAVVWGPKAGQVRELHPLAGDTVGAAIWINDKGQAVGISGNCGNTLIPGFAVAPHAVLWDEEGVAHDLGSFGGTVNTTLLGVGNGAYVINNRSQVAGVSAFPGNQIYHAFLWSKESGIRDLGTLKGDIYSAGLGINDRGDVVGGSLDMNDNPTAYLWHNGVMTDLNDLVQKDSPLHLLVSFWINDAGQIAGFGVTSAGDVHAFRADPCDPGHSNTAWCKCTDDTNGATKKPAVVLSDNARRLLQQHLRVGFFALQPAGPQ